MIKNYRKFILILHCLISLNIYAQVNDANDEKLYMDVVTFMQDYEKRASDLLKSTNYLDTMQARKQLIEKEGQVISINKIPLKKKNISKRDLASLVKESTVVFGLVYNIGQYGITSINPASGYIIDEEGIIVTNYHVVKSFVVNESAKNIGMVIRTTDGNVYAVTEILASYNDADLCIVKIDTKGNRLKALPIGNAAHQGDDVFVMGHPKFMFYNFTQGIVSRNHIRPDSPLKPGGIHEMDITADYGVGASGGPIVDNKGNLIGTVSTTSSLYGDPERKTQLQMVIKGTKPVLCLKKMIRWK